MVNGQYVAFINPGLILVVATVVGIGVYICTGEGIWGWGTFFGVIALGIAINHVFREQMRAEAKEIDRILDTTIANVRDMSSVPSYNSTIESKYMDHYKAHASHESIMENEFIPQHYKAYMVQEVSVWKQMSCKRLIDGNFVTLAYEVYGQAKAWNAMLDDKACMPSVIDRQLGKKNGFPWEERYNVIWEEWKKSGYESYISKFNRTGEFEAPWCKKQPNLPDWVETDGALARKLGSKSKSE